VTLDAATGLETPWGWPSIVQVTSYIGTGHGYSGVDVVSATVRSSSVNRSRPMRYLALRGQFHHRCSGILQFDPSGNLDIRGSSGIYSLSGPAVTTVGPLTTFTVNDTADAALATPSGTTCVSTDAGSCTCVPRSKPPTTWVALPRFC